MSKVKKHAGFISFFVILLSQSCGGISFNSVFSIRKGNICIFSPANLSSYAYSLLAPPVFPLIINLSCKSLHAKGTSSLSHILSSLYEFLPVHLSEQSPFQMVVTRSKHTGKREDSVDFNEDPENLLRDARARERRAPTEARAPATAPANEEKVRKNGKKRKKPKKSPYTKRKRAKKEQGKQETTTLKEDEQSPAPEDDQEEDVPEAQLPSRNEPSPPTTGEGEEELEETHVPSPPVSRSQPRGGRGRGRGGRRGSRGARAQQQQPEREAEAAQEEQPPVEQGSAPPATVEEPEPEEAHVPSSSVTQPRPRERGGTRGRRGRGRRGSRVPRAQQQQPEHEAEAAQEEQSPIEQEPIPPATVEEPEPEPEDAHVPSPPKPRRSRSRRERHPSEIDSPSDEDDPPVPVPEPFIAPENDWEMPTSPIGSRIIRESWAAPPTQEQQPQPEPQAPQVEQPPTEQTEGGPLTAEELAAYNERKADPFAEARKENEKNAKALRDRIRARGAAERQRGPTSGQLEFRRRKKEEREREKREAKKEKRRRKKQERGEEEGGDDDDNDDDDDDDDDGDDGEQDDDDDDESAETVPLEDEEAEEDKDDEDVDENDENDENDEASREQENQPDDRQGTRHFVYRGPVPNDDELQRDLEDQLQEDARRHTSIISAPGSPAGESEGDRRETLESSVSPPMSPTMLQKLREIANMKLEGITSDQEADSQDMDAINYDTRDTGEKGKKARLWWALYRRDMARTFLRSPPEKWKPDPINMRKDIKQLLAEHETAEKIGDKEWKDDAYNEIIRRRRIKRAQGIFDEPEPETDWTETYTNPDEAEGARERGRRVDENEKRRKSQEERRARVPSKERTPDTTSVSPNSQTRGKPSYLSFSITYIFSTRWGNSIPEFLYRGKCLVVQYF